MTSKEKHVFFAVVGVGSTSNASICYENDHSYLRCISLSILSHCVAGKGFVYICFQAGGSGANSTEKCPVNKTSWVKAQKNDEFQYAMKT